MLQLPSSAPHTGTPAEHHALIEQAMEHGLMQKPGPHTPFESVLVHQQTGLPKWMHPYITEDRKPATFKQAIEVIRLGIQPTWSMQTCCCDSGNQKDSATQGTQV